MLRIKLLEAHAPRCCVPQAQAQITAPIKIGVLTDLSNAYSDLVGTGSIEIVRLAVEDFDGKVRNVSIEIVSGDPQNKPKMNGTYFRYSAPRDARKFLKAKEGG